MTPDRWQEVQALFGAVVGLEPAAQAAYLAAACAADPALRDEVLALVAADRRSQDQPFISDAVAAAARALAAEAEGTRVGERVGPYRLVREIGHGGMGTVYLAERADEQYQAAVAIKFVRAGAAAGELERRFRSERQILAGLTHPNIAWLLDAGTAADGTPYLVMEHVAGEPIDRWCEARGLGLEGRLALFQQVCAGVQYAHQALVVHRDLKPSNILVTADGTPKLVDFGIAKLLVSDVDAEVTGTLRLLTPAYGSPEQVRGGRITVATDVYSLGVVLYQLVAGRTPFDFSHASPAEIERRICEEEPPAPSAAAVGRPAAWRRALTGDVDTIVLKALRKEPAQRYGSVEQLAADLQRHATGRPVLARPPALGYRAGKFLRRHRVGVALTGVVVMLLAAFGAAMAVQATRIARERDAAAQSADFLVGLFGIADPEQSLGDTITARAVLDSGAARIHRELAGQPELQARMMAVMARAYENLGLFPKAMDLAREALALRRARFGERHRTVAASLAQVASLYYEMGELDSAVAVNERVLALNRALHGPQSLEAGVSQTSLAHALRARGDYDPAERHAAEAVVLLRRTVRADVDSERTILADAMSNLAQVYHFQGKLAPADSLYRISLLLRRELYGDVHPDISESLNNLAGVLLDEGQLDEAEAMFREALAMDERIHGPEHPDVSADLVNVGRVLRERSDLAGAEAAIRRSVAIDRKFAGPDHWTVGYGLNQLGGLRFDQRDYAGAERLFREALAIYDRSLDADNPYRIAPLLGVGNALIRRGQPAACEPPMRRALRIGHTALPPEHWLIGNVETNLGGCLMAQGRHAEARPLVVAGYERLRAALSATDPRTLRAQERLVTLDSLTS